jgi:hypothetical protein
MHFAKNAALVIKAIRNNPEYDHTDLHLRSQGQMAVPDFIDNWSK